MLKHDKYIAFRNRSRKHMLATLNSFHFWGERIGRIDGDIKEKFGETRWYARLDRPSCIYEVIYLPGPYENYRWNPTVGVKNKVLDALNNVSSMTPILMYLFLFYRIFFYNVAHWIAFAKNPDCARDIISSSDHPNKIIFKWLFLKISDYLNRRQNN